MKLDSILGQYEDTEFRPRIKELRYLIHDRRVTDFDLESYLTDYLKLMIIFDKTMDVSFNSTDGSDGQYIFTEPYTSLEDIIIPVTGNWTSVFQSNDTFITDNISLNNDNVDRYNLIISGFRDQFGFSMFRYEKKTALNVFHPQILSGFVVESYTKKKILPVTLVASSGRKARFSINREGWTEYYNFDEEGKLTVDINIADINIGGTSVTYAGDLWVEVEGLDYRKTYAINSFFYSTGPISLDNILAINQSGEVISESSWQPENQPIFKVRSSYAELPIRWYIYGVSTAPNIDNYFLQSPIVEYGCEVSPNIKVIGNTKKLLCQFNVVKASLLNSQFFITGINCGVLNNQFYIDEIYKDGYCWINTTKQLPMQFNIVGEKKLNNQFEVIANGEYRTKTSLKNQITVKIFGIMVSHGSICMASERQIINNHLLNVEIPGTQNRKDLIYLDKNLLIPDILKGSETSIANPDAPVVPSGSLGLATVLVPSSANSILDTTITDERPLYSLMNFYGYPFSTGIHEIRIQAGDIFGNYSEEKLFELWVETNTPKMGDIITIDPIYGTVYNSEMTVMSNTAYMCWTAPSEQGTVEYYITVDGTIPDENSLHQSDTGMNIIMSAPGIYEVKIRPKTEAGWGLVKIFTIEKAQSSTDLDGYIIFSE